MIDWIAECKRCGEKFSSFREIGKHMKEHRDTEEVVKDE